MHRVKQCLECGEPLAQTVPGGLCSTCALRGALALGTPGARAPDLGYSEPGNSAQPRLFGDYELLEEIARGGMGIVYKARQLSLNRLVAVKMIRAERLARAEEVRRFQQEAAAAARLQQPNIVAIHEAGEFHGQHFYSMDFVDGCNLAELVREHPLPARQAAAHVKVVAEAIRYAHEQGILHRDLKPSNILIDADGTLRVTDFGLAKVLQSQSEMTLTGEVLGSPSYMAPEQASSRGLAIDARADVYALGAILYELMTGRPPFKAESSIETLKLVVENEPVAPRLLNPRVPRDLETICLKCLAKEPWCRYESARALAKELGRFLQGEPILAHPLSAPARAWRWCRRRPAWVGLTGALALALVGGATGVLWQWRAAESARRRAESAERSLTDRLWSSYLAEARANRWSGRAGRRFDSLAAIRQAAAIRPTLELRNEAIACLALPDVRVQSWLPWDRHTRIVGIAFDEDFKRYACVWGDSSISLCRISDNVELRRWAGIGKLEKSSLRFSRDGRFLAQHSEGNVEAYFALWDLKGGRLAFSKPMLVRGVDFAPDDRYIAVGEVKSGVVHIYDLTTSAEVTNFTLGPPINHLAYDPAGKRLAVSREGSPSVVVFDLKSGTTCATLNDAGEISYMAWNPEGSTLACPSSDSHVYLWQVATGQRKILEGHTGVSVATTFNRLGDMLVSAGWEGTTRFWDPNLGMPLVSIPGAWLQNGFALADRRLAFGISEHEVGIWEVEPARECRRLGRAGVVWAAQFAPGGSLLATASSDGVRLWDFEANRLLQHIPLREVRSVIWHPNGTNLLAAGWFGLMRWGIVHRDSPLHTRLESPELLSSQCRESAALSLDGSTLIVANAQPADLLAFEMPETHCPKALAGHGHANFVCLSPDREWFATGTWQGTCVKIWSTKTWQPVQVLPIQGSATCAFSPDGRWLVTGSSKEYRFWRIPSWQPGEGLAREHAGDMYGCICFAPNGGMLALLHGRNRGVKLVSVPEARELADLDTGQPLCFSADSALLATVGEDRQSLFVWDLRLIRQQLAAMNLDWQ